MKKVQALLKRPIVRIGLGILFLVILAGAAGGIYLTQTVPPQPIQFPHVTHVSRGVQCLYCHTSATSGPSAGLPSSGKCWGCHQQITKESAELVKLAEFVRNNQPIPWVPVAIQPDFVHFNHRPHVAAGVACETCHGNVGEMLTAQPQPGQNMGWCLGCHKQMRPEKFGRLSDCSICHY